MDSVIFLFMRRMRAPLLVLLAAYAISIGGLVLMPGVDDQGQPWRFDFFHAFYFVSFMGSTIGFGEIPYEFTDAQRAWTMVAMYLTVIAWLYAIGKILTLVQDPAFKRAMTEQGFVRSVRRLRQPFYIVCGYGETGSLLVRALNRRGIQCVVIDSNPDLINRLALENLSFDTPSLCCSAREVEHLVEAGLKHAYCVGIVALTDSDEVNVKIAITSKLLNPSLKVICRSQSQTSAANLASFNTDHIINPFKVFADHLAMALRTPSVHQLYGWLISMPDQRLQPPIHPPRGHWIVCGFGRFGKAVHRYLGFEGIPTKIIELLPDHAPDDAIIGRGTEAVTLREAGIDKAVGIVAGTDNDANNLSIIVTARQLNEDLYMIARQNRRSNDQVFEAADLDLTMQASRIIVWRILPLLITPLLSHFLRLARHQNEEWAGQLLTSIRTMTGGVTPQTWTVEINPMQAPALYQALQQQRTVRLHHLMREPYDRVQTMPCIPLLLVRKKPLQDDDRKEKIDEQLLPSIDVELRPYDRLLFCACNGVASRMSWILNNTNVLEYVETGEERPDGYLWRWLIRRRSARAENQGKT